MISQVDFRDKIVEAILAGDQVMEILYETLDTKKVSLPNAQKSGTDRQNYGYAFQAARKITDAH